MHYGKIKNCDIANGIGVRVSLFVSGCRNHCERCFQPQTWDFKYGNLFTNETEALIIKLLKPSYISGFTVLGGEPFEPENQAILAGLLARIKEKYPKKSIWVYSGYTYEELTTIGRHPNCEFTEKMLSQIDVLVDGRFEEAKKDISLSFRGSSNQRIIDVPKTLQEQKIILLTLPRYYSRS